MNAILAVMLGGALGALARFGVQTTVPLFTATAFPLATMLVNIVGSFLMGIGVVFFWQNPEISQSLKLFLLTGFLGAFTTFSAFSLDVSVLMTSNNYVQIAIYILGTVCLSIAALLAAIALTKAVLA